MNSLARVLTQKIAIDFLTDCDTVALGSTNSNLLRQLLGSQYQMKHRVDYRIVADHANGCACVCHVFQADTDSESYFNEENSSNTVAVSQPLTFSEPEEFDEEISTFNGRPAPPPLRLAFTRIDDPAMIARNLAYRIGAVTHLRLTRSDDPRTPITQTPKIPSSKGIDSEDEKEGVGWDDGRKGRPQLAHFNFLPSTVKRLELSKTISLSPEVTMSTLHRIESLTLGAIWPWQLTPSAASSYWPPQLKSLKFKNWFPQGSRFFAGIDLHAITFPSTLTELELPKKMYQMLSEEESKQLNAIQYPQGLTKLIRPFIPHRLAGWHLPESLTHLECDLNPKVRDYDVKEWQLPPSLLILKFIDVNDNEIGSIKQNLSCLRLSDSLTSFTLSNKYNESLTEMVFPPSLTYFNFPRQSTIPLDWRHTQLTSFTLHWSRLLPSFLLPSTVIRIEFSHSNSLPRVPSSYVWPPAVREVKITSNLAVDAAGAADAEFVLPSTLRRLDIHANALCVSLIPFALPERLESLHLTAFGSRAESFLPEIVLPSTLTEFIYHGTSAPIPQFSHTQLTRLELLGPWNHSTITKQGAFDLPDTLRSLRFGTDFNLPLDTLRLPAGLTELRFGSKFDQSLTPLANQLPQRLRIFVLLSNKFRHLSSLMSLNLPPSLSDIILPSPESDGIALSEFLHPRYSRFVTTLQEQVASVELISSKATHFV